MRKKQPDNSPNWWSMFEDNTGGISCTRMLLTFMVVIVLIFWGHACWISAAGLADIPSNVIQLLIGFGAAKAIQRFGEKSDGDPPSPPTPAPAGP